jgi:hypothetical protein
MDGIGNNKFASSSPFTPDTPAPSAPPPPSEVKVRTMKSDMASMAKSGGGLPRFENVKVTGLSTQRKGIQGIGIPVTDQNAPPKKSRNGALIAFAVIAALAGLGVFGYIGYQTFFAGKGGNTRVVPPVNTPIVPSGNAGAVGVTPSSTAGGAGTPVATTTFTHISLFKKPVDQTIALAFSSVGSATSSASLQSFSQKFAAALGPAPKTLPALIEVNVKDANGNGVSIEDILSAASQAVLDKAFLEANFNPDATTFVYRDKYGSWPGYVIALQPGKNWLFLQSDVAKLESSPETENFFLIDPGKPSADGFTDSLIASGAVRVLPFLDASVPTYFVYGWSNGNLILSASQGGYAAAVAHLSATP